MSAEAAYARVRLTVGQQLKNLRELQGMTQSALEEACNLPRSTISSIESGRRLITIDQAERIARALKTHPGVIIWPNGWPPDRSHVKGGE